MAAIVTTRGRALALLALAFTCLSITPAWAEPPPRDGSRRRGPPAEAFAACEGKREGAECKVTFHDKTLDGMCVAANQQQLFCMPNDMPPPPHDGPR